MKIKAKYLLVRVPEYDKSYLEDNKRKLFCLHIREKIITINNF